MTSEMVYAVQLAAACTVQKQRALAQASWAERVRMQVPTTTTNRAELSRLIDFSNQALLQTAAAATIAKRSAPAFSVVNFNV
jgi:hypothetical protein